MCFSPATSFYHIAGHHLDQTFLNDPLRPVDDLLRWHFRQAVLANVKGAGVAWLDTEFLSSEDAMNGVTGQYTTTGATVKCTTEGVANQPKGHSENLVSTV